MTMRPPVVRKALAASSHAGQVREAEARLGLHTLSDLSLPPDPPFPPQVNGVLTALPTSVAGGRLSVTQGASKAILTADFGLQVSYDWNWRVEVTLPSSYHGAVCGLCGNMDRNPNNDQAFPNRTLAHSIPVWGGSWRAPGWDPLCWDECQGSCPTCPEDQLEEYRGPGFCGPLAADAKGPFAACHAHVAPESFFKGCVLDVCLGGGAHDILCQALAAYAAACQAAGIVIEDWRTQAGCGECWGEQGRTWGYGSCLCRAGLVSLQSFLFHSLFLSLGAFPAPSYDCLSVSIAHSLSPVSGCLFSLCVYLLLCFSLSLSVPQGLYLSLLPPYPLIPPSNTILSLSPPPPP